MIVHQVFSWWTCSPETKSFYTALYMTEEVKAFTDYEKFCLVIYL